MSSLKSIWPQVRQMAIESGIPDKSRAILREYLQVKALDYLYSQRRSGKLSFVGGTSLRMLYNIPRFSEDLDFDNLGLGDRAIVALVQSVAKRFEAENIPIELFEKNTEGKTYFELRFPELLLELGISTNPREKLMIKIDYEKQWSGQGVRTILMRRLGIIQSVVTNEIDQVLVAKLAAYTGRKSVQPRDMYDVVWLYGKGARLDPIFMRVNNLKDLMERVIARFEREGSSAGMKRRLEPFLFVPGDAKKLDLFGEVTAELAGIESG